MHELYDKSYGFLSLTFQDILAYHVAVTARVWMAPECWRAVRGFPSARPTARRLYPRTKRFTPGETTVS